jgi:hypothetical protein
MTRLDEAINEHGAELEADFRSIYGCRLTDVFRGLMTPREANALVGQLVYRTDSHYRAALLGSTRWIGWGQDVTVLADLFDAVNSNTVVTARVAGAKPQKPDRYPRPETPQADENSEAHIFAADDLDDFPIQAVIAKTSK